MNNEPLYLIIAGISKAGTTSLFDYLADHPDIEGSKVKQTFFFLDKEMQEKQGLKSFRDYEDGLNGFEYFFKKSVQQYKYRVEASPDYLYSPGTPNRIKTYFEEHHGKVLVILRDPVSRFQSFYYYGKQRGLIPETLSYEGFYNLSKNYTENENSCLMAYSTGFYAKPIEEYCSVFGNNFKVVFFEDLKNSPKNVLKEICDFMEIPSDYYDEYTFQVKNATVDVKYRILGTIISNAHQFYADHFHKYKIGFFMEKLLGKTLIPLYRKINYKKLKKNNNDANVNIKLALDYSQDIQKIERLIDKAIPWKN